MAFLELYVDESGHSSRHPFITLAGFIAQAEEWVGFADEWNAALRDANLTRPDGGVGAFHMADCEAFRKDFHGWTEDRRRQLLGRLLPIITKRRLYSIGMVVSVEWWRRHWANAGPDLLPLRDPYHYALQTLLTGILPEMVQGNDDDYADLKDPEGIACVIAQQGEFSAATSFYLLPIIEDLSIDNRVVTVTTAQARHFPQLQAADLYAFELRWAVTRPTAEIRWPLAQLLTSPCEGVISTAGMPGETYYADKILPSAIFLEPTPEVSREIKKALRKSGRWPAKKQRKRKK